MSVKSNVFKLHGNYIMIKKIIIITLVLISRIMKCMLVHIDIEFSDSFYSITDLRRKSYI